MDKEWFTASELLNVGELGSSTQGIHKRARRETWRWRYRRGKQGLTHEYHFNNLPLSTQSALCPLAAEEPAAYTRSHDDDPNARLQDYFAGMDQEECAVLLRFLAENGAAGLLELISKANK